MFYTCALCRLKTLQIIKMSIAKMDTQYVIKFGILTHKHTVRAVLVNRTIVVLFLWHWVIRQKPQLCYLCCLSGFFSYCIVPEIPSWNTPELCTGLSVWWCWCYLTRESQRFENVHCATLSVLKSGIVSHKVYRMHRHVCLFCFELSSCEKHG